MIVSVYKEDNPRGIVDICSMTTEEALILFQTLNAVKNPKPFIKALIVNLRVKLFSKIGE